MSSPRAELRRLNESYLERGRSATSVRWAEMHLIGSAVVIETTKSAYVFVPVYLGDQHVSVTGGKFRTACFTKGSTGESPEVLTTRPYDVKVGEELWLSWAEDRRTHVAGVTIGEVSIDLSKQIPTSTVKAIYVIPADPGSPEF